MKKPKNVKAKPQTEKPKGKRGRPPGSGKKSAAANPAKAPKPDKTEAAKAAIGHNSADPKLRTLFLSYMNGENGCPSIPNLKSLVSKANSKYRAALKAAKKDGFEQFMFETAALVGTPEGEAEFKTKIGRQLLAAQFMGSTVGSQLDLFNEPDRTPATDRAYDEGKQASMSNQAAVPKYSPETEQYRQYMAGFHDHQATLAKGIKQKPDKPVKEPAANRVPAAPGAGQTSGTPMTRSQLKAMQQQQAAPAPTAGAGEHVGDVEADEDGTAGRSDADDGGFARRPAAGSA